MRFTTDTKPLIEALSLGIIDKNVSKFDSKSVMLQLIATEDTLRINIKTSSIASEMKVYGKGEFTDKELETFSETDDKKVVRIVDILMFKKLVSTFDSKEIIFDFVDGGIILYSGSSKFTIPQMVESDDDRELTPPDALYANDKKIAFNHDGWKYIKNHQVFALSEQYTKHPVYMYAYLDEDGNVLTGDIDNSLFTHSTEVNLEKKCLLSPNIIYMLASMPNDTEVYQHDDNFIITYDTSTMTFISEFTPRYEDDVEVGSYNADIFLDMMKIPDDNFGIFKLTEVNKFFTQQALLPCTAISEDEEIVQLDAENNILNMNVGKQYQSSFTLSGNCPDFTLNLKLKYLKNLLSNYSDKELCVAPIANEDGIISGILLWDDDMTTLLAGEE